MIQFKIGEAYSAVPALDGARKRLVVVIGRSDRHIQLAWCDDLSVGEICAFDFGREYVKVSRPDGVYCISAACRIEAADAADVLEFIRPDKQEVAHGDRAERGD